MCSLCLYIAGYRERHSFLEKRKIFASITIELIELPMWLTHMAGKLASVVDKKSQFLVRQASPRGCSIWHLASSRESKSREEELDGNCTFFIPSLGTCKASSLYWNKSKSRIVLRKWLVRCRPLLLIECLPSVSNSYVETLLPSVKILGGETFGTVGSYKKYRDLEVPLPLLPYEVTLRR